MNLDVITSKIPEIKRPLQKKLSFNEKVKWTLLILVLFYALSHVPLFGLGRNSLERFELLSVILGAKFGSLISLGIGPIVTASIVLQLLTGSGILNIDTTTDEGKKFFEGLQKILSLFFIFFEASVYVFMGGLAPPAGHSLYFALQWILVAQLSLGGLMILFMDDVITKWGFGSGVSLFIAAGVSKELFIRTFSWLPSAGSTGPIGAIPTIINGFVQGLTLQELLIPLSAIAATAFVLIFSIYAQAMKVEIPLSFGRVRGYGIRWPLRFLYTSNIPVILTAALIANLQLWASLLENWGKPILGSINGSTGLVSWFVAPKMLESLITGSFSLNILLHALSYMAFLIIGATIFSVFWVKTSGMDAQSQAKQIVASGLQRPGFRKDDRIIEHLLNRYIPSLTILGGATIGLLAAVADVSGALANGTGILLTVMIVFNLYEEIAKQHMMDMHPSLRRFIE